MNTSKTTPTTLTTNQISDVATPAKSAIPAAFVLGLLGALAALTPPAIGQVPAGQNRATDLSATPPIPTRIIQPVIADRYAGMQVKMTFWVDKYDAGCNDLGADRNLVSTLSANLALWKFTPAKDADGNPVARRVTLPVTIHAPKDGRETLVAFGPIK